MSFPSNMFNRNVRTIDTSTLTTSYQNLGNALTIVGYEVAIVNPGTKDVQISDGSAADAYYIPAGSTLSIGKGNSSYGRDQDNQASFRKGAQLQVKLPSGVAGTGTLVVTVIGN